MKKFLLIFLMILAFGLQSEAKKVEDPAQIPDYLIEGVSARSGQITVKVTIITKKPKNVTDAMLAKAAVHGVLFRGSVATGNGNHSAKFAPLAGSPTAYEQHRDFFEPFFANGTYMSYAQLVADTRRQVKAGKEYHVSANVTVAASQLKKDLSDNGVGTVRGLGTGF